MKRKRPDNLQFDLVENGIDFISSGVEHILNDKSHIQLKYAILHLSAGTELLLKEVLKNEHWTLIFDKLDTAKLDLLKSGDFKSVDLETSIIRITNICKINISTKDISILRQLKKLRNKIEHFGFDENLNVIKSIASRVLCLILNFINENLLHKELSATAQGGIEMLKTNMGRFKEFAILRTAQIKESLNNSREKYKIESCPLCRQAALVLNSDISCLFCGYSDTPLNIAELYAENILGEYAHNCITDGGDFPVIECIHCGEETFVNKGENGFVCFNCFESNQNSELQSCNLCGQLYESNIDEAGMCGYCIDYIFSSDK